MARIEDIPKDKLDLIIDMIKAAQETSTIYSAMEIRLHKCDYDYDRFIKMHKDTDTELPSVFDEALIVSEIPYEDLPLYINDVTLGKRIRSYHSTSHMTKEYILKLVSARLMIGR